MRWVIARLLLTLAFCFGICWLTKSATADCSGDCNAAGAGAPGRVPGVAVGECSIGGNPNTCYAAQCPDYGLTTANCHIGPVGSGQCKSGQAWYKWDQYPCKGTQAQSCGFTTVICSCTESFVSCYPGGTCQ